MTTTRLKATDTGPALRLLSLGAGVQSTTVLLLACEGEIPRFDVALFADTGLGAARRLHEPRPPDGARRKTRHPGASGLGRKHPRRRPRPWSDDP